MKLIEIARNNEIHIVLITGVSIDESYEMISNMLIRSNNILYMSIDNKNKLKEYEQEIKELQNMANTGALSIMQVENDTDPKLLNFIDEFEKFQMIMNEIAKLRRH